MRIRSIRRARVAVALSLLCATSAQAAILTVGPGGTNATIQSAIDDAMFVAGNDEIRVAQGTWNERIAFTHTSSDAISIRGGWNATFTTQTLDPALTRINAQSLGGAWRMDVVAGTIAVSGFTFEFGRAEFGAGLAMTVRNSASVVLSDCRLSSNLAQSAASADGGGLSVGALGNASVEIARCEVVGNEANSTASQATGGGMNIDAFGSATIVARNLVVNSNRLDAPAGSSAAGAGIDVGVTQQGSVQLLDAEVRFNTIDSGESAGSGVSLSAGQVPDSTGQIQARRLFVEGNASSASGLSAQLVAETNQPTSVIVGDSLIINGDPDGGVYTRPTPPSQISLVNLTIADNNGADLTMWQGGNVSNTLAGELEIAFGVPVQASNLIGGDPQFVNPAGGNYRLRVTSPAFDAGTATPAGGLGTLDLDGNARVQGATVDLGAYEFRVFVFGDGFEG